jgi:hypothetical protein
MPQDNGEGLISLDLASPAEKETYSGLTSGVQASNSEPTVTTHQFRSRWGQPAADCVDLHAVGSIASRSSRPQRVAPSTTPDLPEPENAAHVLHRSVIGAVAGAALLLAIGGVTMLSGHATAKDLHTTGRAGAMSFVQSPDAGNPNNAAAPLSPAANPAPVVPAPASSAPAGSARTVSAPAAVPAAAQAPAPVPAPIQVPVASTPTPASPKPSPTPQPVLAGPYSGLTSQGQPVSFTVSGSTVTSISFGWSAVCSDGQRHTNSIAAGSTALSGNTFTLNTQFPSTPTPLSVSFHGVLSGKSASGTFSRSGGSAFGTNCSASGTWSATFQ